MDIDKTTTFHAFVKSSLDLDLRRRLDHIRLTKKAAGNSKFGWDDVVTVSRDLQAGGLLGEEEVQPR
jgi:hypothetical protein